MGEAGGRARPRAAAAAAVAAAAAAAAVAAAAAAAAGRHLAAHQSPRHVRAAGRACACRGAQAGGRGRWAGEQERFAQLRFQHRPRCLAAAAQPAAANHTSRSVPLQPPAQPLTEAPAGQLRLLRVAARAAALRRVVPNRLDVAHEAGGKAGGAGLAATAAAAAACRRRTAAAGGVAAAPTAVAAAADATARAARTRARRTTAAAALARQRQRGGAAGRGPLEIVLPHRALLAVFTGRCGRPAASAVRRHAIAGAVAIGQRRRGRLGAADWRQRRGGGGSGSSHRGGRGGRRSLLLLPVVLVGGRARGRGRQLTAADAAVAGADRQLC